MRVMLALSVLESLATLASAATPTTSGTPLPIPKDLRCATSFPDRETLKTPCIDPLQARLHTPTIHFDVGRARIRPTSYATLDALASLLTRVPIGLTEVQRHKASDGRQAYGRRPTRDRARAVKRYLVDHGIAPARLVAQGYGESMPVALNRTAEGRRENRRMAYVILRWGPPDCSDACDTHGACLFFGGRCTAVSAQDCTRSSDCAQHNRCRLERSTCVSVLTSTAPPAP